MKKIKEVCLALFVRLTYFIWSVWNHIFYMPRIKYASRKAKKLMKRTPCILIANHTAHADGYFLPQALPKRRLYTYVTRKWYDKPKLNWMFSRLKYIPIDLTSMDTEWLARGEKVLADGGSILIFPEGKLCEVGTLGEFHPGALMLAKKTGVPVIPVALIGEYRPFRPKRMIVGEPIPLNLDERGRPSVILRRESEKCREVLREMLEIPADTVTEVEEHTAEAEVKTLVGAPQ